LARANGLGLFDQQGDEVVAPASAACRVLAKRQEEQRVVPAGLRRGA